MALAQPPADATSSAGYIWSLIDKRIQAGIKVALDAWGKPRARTLTINIPLAGFVTPLSGWLASVGLWSNTSIVGWSITALTPGSISLDLRVTSTQTSQAAAITPVSILGTATISMTSGYTTTNQNTTNWATSQISSGSTLHVYVLSAAAIQQAVLFLRVIDTDTKTIGR